jgi:hypothetical protein
MRARVVAVQPAHLKAGQALRQRCLNDDLHQAEDAFIGHWTVRRHIGKGVPPAANIVLRR